MITNKVDEWSFPLTRWHVSLIRPRKNATSYNVPVKNETPETYDVTVLVYEDDLLTHCNHAGAYLGLIDQEYVYGNPITGDYDMHDYSVEAIVCDACGAWQDSDGEWYE